MASPRQSIDAPLLEYTEKQDLKTYHNSAAALHTRRLKDSHKMQSRSILLWAFLMCSLAALGITSVVAPRNAWQWPCPRGHEVGHSSVEPSRTNFVESLKDVSPESLNDLLQKFFPAKFQHGVFPSEHHAAEADPAMAPAVIQIAKRDGNNSSTTETTTSTSSSESTLSTPITSTSTTPTASSTSTSKAPPASSPTTESTSASSATTTMITRTESSTSSTSSLSSSRLVTTYTSTNANGGVVVVTATTYVAVGADQTPSTTSTRPSGSLQTNAAPSGRGRNVGLELVMGAVLGGALLA